jgi:hypothetical protein
MRIAEWEFPMARLEADKSFPGRQRRMCLNMSPSQSRRATLIQDQRELSRKDRIKVAQQFIAGKEKKGPGRPVRDAMKVAHHFCGGSWNKRRARPGGTIEALPSNVLLNKRFTGFLEATIVKFWQTSPRSKEANRSSLPGRTRLFTLDPALRTGLLSLGPCGTSLWHSQSLAISSWLDANARLRGRFLENGRSQQRRIPMYIGPRHKSLIDKADFG